MIEACICTIGDEILIGQIVDTNSALISRELNSIGIKVNSIISIGDDHNQIISILNDLTDKFSIVIITGGLGPTKDDITKKALAELTGAAGFIFSTDQYKHIEEIFAKRGMPMTELNRNQAMVPDTCRVIPNKKGTAPGMVFTVNNKIKSLLFSLPGVPFEMESLLPYVIEVIESEFVLESISHKTIATFGMPESTLSDFLNDWENNLPKDIKLAYLPNPALGIRLRLSVYNGSKEESAKRIDLYAKELKSILTKDLYYGEDFDTLESVVSQKLRESGKKITVAESCTGGHISSLITAIPGSSDVYNGGIVCYSNNIKISTLGVKEETLKNHGAVSMQCAQEMAEGARKLFKSDYAIATTGIAGPTGGSNEKPIGTIWIAVAGPNKTHSMEAHFFGDRERNIIRFSSEALNFARKILVKEL